MVNVETSWGNYCLTLVQTTRTIGKNQNRPSVIAELWRDGQLVTAGMSLCHPTDKFDARKGAHLAVNKMAKDLFGKQDLREIHKKVDSWFQQ
jgi:hypothetical protein